MATSLPPAVLSLLSLSHGPTIQSHIHPTSQQTQIDHSPSVRQGHKRRLSSTGQTRRRMSDARDAAARPTVYSSLSSAAAALSLSSSPPQPDVITKSVPLDAVVSTVSAAAVPPAKPLEPEVQVGPGGKKKTIFRCESCSKVYRHPTCLVKHRWEHSPHWRESSKLPLSKHQQVQMLEAAAILSHLSPSTSLPDDRSLWPTYLSGGLGSALPIASSVPSDSVPDINGHAASAKQEHPVSARRDGIVAVRVPGAESDEEEEEEAELGFELEMDDDDAAPRVPVANANPVTTAHPRINGFATPFHPGQMIHGPMMMPVQPHMDPARVAAAPYPVYPPMMFVPIPVPTTPVAVPIPAPLQIPRGRTAPFGSVGYRDPAPIATSVTSSIGGGGGVEFRDPNLSQSYTSSSYASSMSAFSPFSQSGMGTHTHSTSPFSTAPSRHSHSRSFGRASRDSSRLFDHSRSFERGSLRKGARDDNDDDDDDEDDDEDDDSDVPPSAHSPSDYVAMDEEPAEEVVAEEEEPGWNGMEMEMEFAQ